MASHQDLLDAIARIRTATGDPDGWTTGLSGEDIAVATNPLSTSGALGAVMAKLIAAHPDSFLSGPRPTPQAQAQAQAEGVAAEAIRGAEAALGQQRSTTAQVDLQVLTAVLNAHATHAEGVAALDRLQREIEDAAAARVDLDTPAGARAFQRYLVDKLRDIRTVVETAGLDSASKAALAAALANLYTASTPESVAEQSNQTSTEQDPAPRRTGDDEVSGDAETAGPVRASEPVDPPEGAFDPLSAFADDLGPPQVSEPVAAPAAPAVPAPPVGPPAAGWGGGFPAAAPLGGGMPALPSSLPNFDADPPMELTDRLRRESGAPTGDESEPGQSEVPDEVPDEVSDEASPDQPGGERPEGATTVVLPGGETVVAPSMELAAVITAAMAGTPIQEAFRQQDITIPEPGTTVTGPLDAAQLVPGDIGLLTDRHALALGNGKVFLDQQIQPIASVTGPGFLGWQHPPQPQPEPIPTPPEPPAPIPSAETAPS